MDYLDSLALEKQKEDFYSPDESEPIFYCTNCKKEIYYGDNYYETDLGDICEDCFDEIQINEKRECERIAGEDDGD